MSEGRQLAIVTGASSGIGYELAKICSVRGFDVIVVANERKIDEAAASLRHGGREITPIFADLATPEGVEATVAAAGGRPVDYLMANAGRGMRGAFLDQSLDDIAHTIDTNVTGTLRLVHRVGQQMRERRNGRILVTGSIAGFVPGPMNAVYNASKAFVDSFCWALHNELDGTGVSVTCLMPGATETQFFERAGLLDTKIGQSRKDDPADVARIGFEAMMNGDADVVAGWHNKLAVALANITPASMLAAAHRRAAEPAGAGR